MADSSVSKYLSVINHQIASQEHISEFLSQAIAMLNVALTGDFSAFDGPTVHYYLSAMDGIITRTRSFNEQILEDWLRVVKSLKEPPGAAKW